MEKSTIGFINLMYLLGALFLVSCGQQQSDPVAGDTQIHSAMVSSDTTIELAVKKTDLFYQVVDEFSKDFPNQKPTSPQLVDTLSDLSTHWFLLSLEKHRKRLEGPDDSFSARRLQKLPTKAEVAMISYVRQGAYHLGDPLNNEVVFEEWNFENNNDAERWLVLLRDSLRGNDFTKPPRYQWVEGSRMYLVSTRTASRWFESSDSLIMRLSGKTRMQLSRLYDPLDLKRFKRMQGPSNSTLIDTQPYLHQHGQGGHYSYFYFVKQRLSGEERAQSGSEFPSRTDFNITTSLHEPFAGTEQYDKIKETLVAIQCAIKAPELDALDIVGKTLTELEESFGVMIHEQENNIVFGHFNRVIVAKMDNRVVKQFKYMRLIAPFSELESNEDMINSILNFE